MASNADLIWKPALVGASLRILEAELWGSQGQTLTLGLVWEDFRSIPGGAYDLFLALQSGVTPGRAWETFGVLGIKLPARQKPSQCFSSLALDIALLALTSQEQELV